jgi:membrane protein
MAAPTKPYSFAGIKYLLTQAWTEFNQDNVPRLGASLAYYTILSIAPLLVVAIAIAGLVFGKEAAQGQIVAQIQGMVGDEGAKAIQAMIEGASNLGQGIVASLIGVITLLFGATNVVTELRNTLNTVWDVPSKKDTGVKDMIRERSYALGVVLGCGFLLLVSLVVSAVLAGVGAYFERMLPLPEAVFHAINLLISMAVITAIFALLFRLLPDIQISWHDVWLGAAFTAVLFTLGKYALGIYLGKASFGSTYGAAGSLVIVLVWVYYSAQILFFGAEFTQVYAREYGTDPMKQRPVAAPEPRKQEWASSAAGGNAALAGSGGGRARSAIFTGGLLVGVFAAAAREVKALVGKKQ